MSHERIAIDMLYAIADNMEVNRDNEWGTCCRVLARTALGPLVDPDDNGEWSEVCSLLRQAAVSLEGTLTFRPGDFVDVVSGDDKRDAAVVLHGGNAGDVLVVEGGARGIKPSAFYCVHPSVALGLPVERATFVSADQCVKRDDPGNALDLMAAMGTT